MGLEFEFSKRNEKSIVITTKRDISVTFMIKNQQAKKKDYNNYEILSLHGFQ